MKESLASKILYQELTKPQKEKWVVSSVLERLTLGYTEIKGQDKPDIFVVFSENCCVSIEVTEYFSDMTEHGSKQQTLLSNWTKFSKSLCEGLKSRSLENFYGAVHFKSSETEFFQRINKKKLKKELIDLVELNKNTQQDNISNFSNFPCLSEFVNHIYLRSISPENDVLWWHASLQSGQVNNPNKAIYEIIKQKNCKYNNYEIEKSNESWLIIFAQATVLANTLGILHLDYNNYYKLNTEVSEIGVNFSRIIVWDKFSETIAEIFPKYKIIFKAPYIYTNNIPSFLNKYIK